jgi:hypothetical protein
MLGPPLALKVQLIRLIRHTRCIGRQLCPETVNPVMEPVPQVPKLWRQKWFGASHPHTHAGARTGSLMALARLHPELALHGGETPTPRRTRPIGPGTSEPRMSSPGGFTPVQGTAICPRVGLIVAVLPSKTLLSESITSGRLPCMLSR